MNATVLRGVSINPDDFVLDDLPEETTAPSMVFKLSRSFARREHLPLFIAARIVAETEEALRLVGHGAIEHCKPLGRCCRCGRELTHPVSVELGIGPVCGGHYWDWSLISGYREEDLQRARQRIRQGTRVDRWIPKACIINSCRVDQGWKLEVNKHEQR